MLCTHHCLHEYQDTLWAFGEGKSAEGSERGSVFSWWGEEEGLYVLCNYWWSHVGLACVSAPGPVQLVTYVLQPLLPGFSQWETTSSSGHSGPSGCSDKPRLGRQNEGAGPATSVAWPWELRPLCNVYPKSSFLSWPGARKVKALWALGRGRGVFKQWVTSGFMKAWQSQAHVTNERGNWYNPSGDSLVM